MGGSLTCSGPASFSLQLSISTSILQLLGLLCLLHVSATSAHILVLNMQNETLQMMEDEPARFGPSPSDTGTWGYMRLAHPINGCTKMESPPNASLPYIAIIRRNECNFDLKVLNAQKAGFKAAVVHNVGDGKLVPMQGDKYVNEIEIISVFISAKDGNRLLEYVKEGRQGYSLFIQDIPPLDPEIYLIPFAIVVGICFIVMVIFVIVKWVMGIRRKRRSRLSKANLNKIPVKKFRKGDPYDICAVCLDEYEDGEKLRILPCAHAYHQKCIDPWLTKNKRTCPLCKKKVVPGEPDTSSSEDDSEHDSGGEANETAPLLGPPRRGGPRSSRRTTGNTFDSSGLPASMRSDVHRAPEADTSSYTYSTSSDDSAEPSTSMYQSSVEVHGSNPLCGLYSTESDPTNTASPSSCDFRTLIQPVLSANQDSRSRSSSSGMEDGAVGGEVQTTFELVEDHFQDARSSPTEQYSCDRAQPLVVEIVGNIQEAGDSSNDDDDHRLLVV